MEAGCSVQGEKMVTLAKALIFRGGKRIDQIYFE